MAVLIPEMVDLTRQYVEDPASHGLFDQAGDGRTIIACIEPKDPARIAYGDHKIVRQTSGGGPGEGLDNALGLTIIRDELVTVEEGMTEDTRQRPDTVGGAHTHCKFIGGLLLVTSEMADPSERTLDTVDHWLTRLPLEVQGMITPRTFMRTMDAAKKQQEHIRSSGPMDHLVAHASNLYPDISNVGDVVGDGPTYVWTTNFTPDQGQNRNNKSRRPIEALLTRTYYLSLGASIDHLRQADIPNDVRVWRLRAKLLREAAVRTVVTSENLEDTVFYEVAKAAEKPSGLEIKQENVA